MQPELDPQGGSELSVPAGVQAEAKQRIPRECCKRDSNIRKAELTPLPLQNKQQYSEPSELFSDSPIC